MELTMHIETGDNPFKIASWIVIRTPVEFLIVASSLQTLQ